MKWKIPVICKLFSHQFWIEHESVHAAVDDQRRLLDLRQNIIGRKATTEIRINSESGKRHIRRIHSLRGNDCARGGNILLE